MNTEIAGKEQKIASDLQIQIYEQNIIIKKDNEEANLAVKAAEPALERAQKALMKLK